jgi:2-dehydro-3-deoxyglucarate aldolase/4-hydroxy-2-oxoheptanedioate aldolase
MSTSFKQLITATNELVPLFALGRIIHPVVVEMFGRAGGYRGFWFDQEHASISTEQIAVMSLAARANDMDTFVRMPPTGYWQVTQALEAGAGGVMAAQIFSAEQAAEFVSWAKFSPNGVRGLNSSGFDADYSHKPLAQFVEDANRGNFVAIQIETLQSVEQADQIAALAGVDLLFVGPADLSLALGIPGQFHHEKLWEAINRVSHACRNHGIAWGAVVPDPEFADRAVKLGCRMPTMGNDVQALRHGIKSLQTDFASQFSSR